MGIETRTMSVWVGPTGKPSFEMGSFLIKIEDKGCGEYVTVHDNNEDFGKIGIEVKDWSVLKEAIDSMIKDCRGAPKPKRHD